MNIGNQISAIRKEHQLTQEKFGELFHVTRQTVSNWENEKSYPDLNILIAISNRFGISLDQLLKEDGKMVQAIDRERIIGKIKREKSLVDFLTGAGGGLVVSCLFSSDSPLRTIVICVGVLMLGVGFCKKESYDKQVLAYLEQHREEPT